MTSRHPKYYDTGTIKSMLEKSNSTTELLNTMMKIGETGPSCVFNPRNKLYELASGIVAKAANEGVWKGEIAIAFTSYGKEYRLEEKPESSVRIPEELKKERDFRAKLSSALTNNQIITNFYGLDNIAGRLIAKESGALNKRD